MTWDDIDRVLVGFYELHGRAPQYLHLHAADWAGIELAEAGLRPVSMRHGVNVGRGHRYNGVEVRRHSVESLRGYILPGPPVVS